MAPGAAAPVGQRGQAADCPRRGDWDHPAIRRDKDTMIKPAFITFTGVDARTDIGRLCALSSRYPVEWGVLFSRTNQGRANRYPALEHVGQLRKLCAQNRIQLAAHICGGYSNEIMQGGYHPDLSWGLVNLFSRTQINVNDGETLVDGHYVKAEHAAKFAAHIGARRAVVQCCGAFPDDHQVDWLYDLSGGAGREPQSWDAAASQVSGFVGYAGGIGPNNVLRILSQIEKTHPEGKPFWIDMEGRIRDVNDWLDLDACEAVLAAVYGKI